MRLLKYEVWNRVKDIFNKKDPLLAQLIINWHAILDYGVSVYPVKISYSKTNDQVFRTLYLKVDDTALSTKIFFEKKSILDKIAVYIGYKCIHNIKIISR